MTILRGGTGESNRPVRKGTLQALAERNPRLLAALGLLFRKPGEIASFQDLRIQPTLALHRNPISEKPFVLPKERFEGTEDVQLVPLMRKVVDQTLRAYMRGSSDLWEYVGKTPITPHGSMGLSVIRWGHVDWDFVRDMDWRIFLPPQLGHLSGFKTDLSKELTSELQEYGLYTVLLGKDERGLPQVQVRDHRTGRVHGFHIFLIGLKPGFVRGNIHHDGGYSPHYAYFPEGSIDKYLQAGNMQWAEVIQQQRDHYIDMFSQLSFNIFGEDSGETGKLKTPGWYLHKAFKWYATLARMRGLWDLEQDLLYQYEHFQGSEADLPYLARYRYYARMAPGRLWVRDVERDLAQAASVVCAKARNPLDPLVGQQIGDDRGIVLLEAVPEDFAARAWKCLEQHGLPLPSEVCHPSPAGRLHFADRLSAPSCLYLPDGKEAVAIPSEWSMVFSDFYIRQVMNRVKEEKQPLVEKDFHQALVMVMASLIHQALDERSTGTPAHDWR
jgi:hypothetical protein